MKNTETSTLNLSKNSKYPTEISLNFTRPEGDAKKFASHSLTKPWPPAKSMIPYVQNLAMGNVENEIKSILKPQLQNLKTCIDSNSILAIIIEKFGNEQDMYKSAYDYYTNISNEVFAELTQKAPELLGKEDTCGWFSD